LIAGAVAQAGANNLQYRQITNVTSQVLTVDATLVDENIVVTSLPAHDAFVTASGFPDSSPVDVGPVEGIQLDGGQASEIVPNGQNDDVAHAIFVSTQHARVRNAKISGWRGIGALLEVDPIGWARNKVE
jgi:hypothetical protein